MGPSEKIDWIERRIGMLMAAIEFGQREGTDIAPLKVSDAQAIVRTLKEYRARVAEDLPRTANT